MPVKTKSVSKKQLKEHINLNGGYLPSIADIQKNIPKAAEKKIREKYSEAEANEMIEKGTYVKGISSNGDLNRNGYIIRAKAWKPAIEGYMANPIVLLQHNSDKVIGVTISAKVTKNGLETESILFKDQMDEQSALAFERGQLKAFSTGHITRAIEWENTETGEIKSTEEFRELPWEERWKEEWVMVVVALEWVEQSLVSIPSNRESMITHKNQKLNWFENKFGEDMAKFKKDFAGDEEPEDEIEDDVEENDIDEEEENDEEEETVEETEENKPQNGMMSVKITQEMIDDPTQGPKLKALGLLVNDVIEIPTAKSEAEPTDEELEEIEEEESEENDLTPPAGNAEDLANAENAEQEEDKPEDEVENTETEDNSVVAMLNASALQLSTSLLESIEKSEKEEQEEELAPVENEFKINLESFETIQKSLEENGLVEVSELLGKLVGVAEDALEQVERLENVLDAIPKRKGLRVAMQHGENKIPAKKTAAKKNENPNAGKALSNAFEAKGLSNLLRRG